jgi:hypothetical protein
LKPATGYEVIKMKNKPDPTQLRTAYPSNEIKKRIPKSRETIHLKLDIKYLKYF